MTKLLIATTNKGKFKEIIGEFKDLHFDFVCLEDLKKKIKEPIENQDTIEGNAYKKAKYYAKKSGLLTLADDTGLYIDALKGWPGVFCARIGKTDEQRKKNVLEKMKGKRNRSATFRCALTIYDPKQNSSFSAFGETKGTILEKEVKKNMNGFGYDPIFKVTSKNMTFAEMTSMEKNMISHRGIALEKIKHYLIKQTSFRQYIVPVSIIVKDKKMLMNKRRDMRVEYNNAWEFPGGAVEIGESIESSLIRETKEETGYTIKIIERLPNILNEFVKKYNYHVFLVPFVCKISSGRLAPADNEVSGSNWFTISAALKENLIKLNKKVISNKDNLNILKKYITY